MKNRIIEIESLLKKILDEAYPFSRKFYVTENESRKSIQDYNAELLDTISRLQDTEQLSNLRVPLIECYFKKMLPLIVFPAEEFVRGDMHRIQDIQRLQEMLDEDPGKFWWANHSVKYLNLMQMFGFAAPPDVYQNLTEIVQVLIDAFTFYNGKSVYQVRKGKVSSMQPKFIDEISIFANEYEMVKAVEEKTPESCILFAAKKCTFAETEPYLENWVADQNNGGYSDGKGKWIFYGADRMWDYMRNKRFTKEQYLAMEDESAGRVYLVVKNGGNIWMIPDICPFGEDGLSFYSEGKRQSYFPYQVLFQSFSGCPEGSTELKIQNETYLIRNFVDEEQSIFLPIFLYETKQRFFSRVVPESELRLLPQETVLSLPDGKENKNMLAPLGEVLTVESFSITPIDQLFAEEPAIITLLQAMGMDETVLADIPILPTETLLSKEEYEKQLIENQKTAYRTLIECRLRILNLGKDRDEYEKFLNEAFQKREEEIHQDFLNLKFLQYSSDVIHYETGLTDSCGDRMRRYHPFYPDERITKNSTTLPVVIKVRPVWKEELMEFYGWKESEDLPFLLKYRDEILHFYGYKEDSLNNNSGSGIVDIDGMNVCMGKAFYKKHFAPHFFEKKSINMSYIKKEKAKEWKEKLSQNGYEVEVEIKNEKTAVCCVYARKII